MPASRLASGRGRAHPAGRFWTGTATRRRTCAGSGWRRWGTAPCRTTSGRGSDGSWTRARPWRNGARTASGPTTPVGAACPEVTRGDRVDRAVGDRGRGALGEPRTRTAQPRQGRGERNVCSLPLTFWIAGPRRFRRPDEGSRPQRDAFSHTAHRPRRSGHNRGCGEHPTDR